MAESETLGPPPVLSSFGRGRGEGSENNLEPRSSLAVGEITLLDMTKERERIALVYRDTGGGRFKFEL